MKKKLSTSYGQPVPPLQKSFPEKSADISAIQPWFARALIKWHIMFLAWISL